MTSKEAIPQFSVPVQGLHTRPPLDECDLPGYVRSVTLVLLLDLQKDVDRVVDYLIPLWDLLKNHRLKLDHEALARQIEQDHGVNISGQYRKAVTRWRDYRKDVARRNRPN